MKSVVKKNPAKLARGGDSLDRVCQSKKQTRGFVQNTALEMSTPPQKRASATMAIRIYLPCLWTSNWDCICLLLICVANNLTNNKSNIHRSQKCCHDVHCPFYFRKPFFNFTNAIARRHNASILPCFNNFCRIFWLFLFYMYYPFQEYR